jgi:Carbohydrate binding domain (family 11)
MKHRLFLNLTLLIIILLGMNFAHAQAVANLTLYHDEDSLTLYIPGQQPSVSLTGLSFRAADRPDIYSLDQYLAFKGFPFEGVQGPICFRLVRNGSDSIPPQECYTAITLIQPVISANVFWSEGGVPLIVTVIQQRTEVAFCPLPVCSFQLAIEIPPPPSDTPTPPESVQVTNSKATAVNIRSGPGTNCAAVDALPVNGTELVCGRNEAGDWLNLCSDSQRWIAVQVVSTQSNIQSLPVIPSQPCPDGRIVANFNNCIDVNNVGGEIGRAYQTGTVTINYPTESGRGCVAKMDYTDVSWAGMWMKLGNLDMCPYHSLSFKVKSDHTLSQIKIEIKDSTRGQTSIIRTGQITTNWQDMSFVLSNFGSDGFNPTVASICSIDELAFVVESGGTGTLYIDNIYLWQ